MEILLLRRYFSCLLDNSERHGKDVNFAHFSGRYGGSDLIIEYTDDGGGIAEQDKSRIFERGFGKNTGYGLFLARDILAFSGNTIKETGVHGEGAKFEITFPEGSFRYLPE